jgi:hypothetical protein
MGVRWVELGWMLHVRDECSGRTAGLWKGGDREMGRVTWWCRGGVDVDVVCALAPVTGRVGGALMTGRARPIVAWWVRDFNVMRC